MNNEPSAHFAGAWNVLPTIEIEESEGDWTSAIAAVDAAVSAWLVASELATDASALDHYRLVRGAAGELRDALDALDFATAMLSRHDFYRDA